MGRDEGGGITRVFAQGDALEKGGINFSDVVGKELLPSATQSRPDFEWSSLSSNGGIGGFSPL